jgi:hypothetical protein
VRGDQHEKKAVTIRKFDHRPWFANRLLCTELAINDVLAEVTSGSISYFDTAEVS